MIHETGAPLSGDDLYWQSAGADEAMQDEHGFMWRAMLETGDMGLSGKLVLDAGCNRGGFLRLLCKECGITAGFGYDPAPGAIADARRLPGSCPLTRPAGLTWCRSASCSKVTSCCQPSTPSPSPAAACAG